MPSALSDIWRRVATLTPIQRIGVAVATVLAVALLIIALIWVRAVPWEIRRILVQIAFCSVAILLLWLLLRSGRFVPGSGTSCHEAKTFKRAGLIGLSPLLLVAALSLSLLGPESELSGFPDWDQFLQKYEAIRQSIVTYHQFPWWNPWRRGGFALAAEPETGLVSPATVLVVIFGSSIGLRLSGLLYVALSVEGARRLGRHLFRCPIAAVAVGLVYGLNGAVLVYLLVGLYIPMSYCSFPWMIYFIFKLRQSPWSAIWLGAWASFNLLNGIQYPSIYAFMLSAVFWGSVLLSQPASLLVLLKHSLMALGVFLSLTSWRIVTLWSLIGDFPRRFESLLNTPPGAILGALVHRMSAESIVDPAPLDQPWERACYIGPVVLLLVLASLRRGLRWWHVLGLFCFWCSVGTFHWYQPSFWLKEWPVFSALHTASRWRIPGLLGVALACGCTIAWLTSSRSRILRASAIALVALTAVDFTSYGMQLLPHAFVERAEEFFPGPVTGRLVNIEKWHPEVMGREALLTHACTLRGYGVIRAHEALMGYDRNAKTARVWKGHPDYRGEFTSEGRAITPSFWSPNRIVLTGAPGRTVTINQNPGSWWLANRNRLFPRYRCAEWNRPFRAKFDGTGTLELLVQPPSLKHAYWLTPLGVLMFVFGLRWRTGTAGLVGS